MLSKFVADHEIIFVVEQNRDGQMRTLLINELEVDPAKMRKVLYYAGLSISANNIHRQISEYFDQNNIAKVAEVKS